MLMQGKSIASRRKENMRRAYSNSSLPEPTYPGGGLSTQVATQRIRASFQPQGQVSNWSISAYGCKEALVVTKSDSLRKLNADF
eukprot:341690-Prorocentrum_minimum.AAC.3